MNNKTKGAIGESLACEYIEKKGFSILAKNWRFSRVGEIDIIAKDKNTLVFIEVKTRTTTSFGHPIEAVDSRKISQMKTVASLYLAETKEDFKSVRFDAIAVLGDKKPEITHYKDILRY